MHVLYVNKVSPILGGGAELRLLEIARRLVKSGHQVSVLCSKTEVGLPDQQEIDGISIHYLSLIPEWFFRFEKLAFYLSRYLFYFATLFTGKRVSELSPDIIVDYASPSASLIYFIAKRQNVPCCLEVMEYLGFKEWFSSNPFLSAIFGFLSENLLLRLIPFDKFISISKFTEKNLIAAGISEQDIEYIPMGVDLDELVPQSPIERNRNRIIYIARLVPQKGHKYLIDAIQIAQKTISDIELVLIGDGPMMEELRSHASNLGIGQHVDIVGRKTSVSKTNLLWSSSIFAMPSIREGFGLVLLEAMACGLPIVAFDLEVYREFLTKNCGYTVEPTDSQAMAQQIIYLLTDTQIWADRSQHNLSYIKQFDWDELTREAEQLLSTVIRENKGFISSS